MARNRKHSHYVSLGGFFGRRFALFNQHFWVEDIRSACEKAAETRSKEFLEDPNHYGEMGDDLWLGTLHCDIGYKPSIAAQWDQAERKRASRIATH